MRIVVHNLRMGFATNSSSTHSIVLLPPDLTTANFRDRDAYTDGHFGWDQFVLASPEAKCRYLAAQFLGSAWDNRDAREKIIAHFSEQMPWLAEHIDDEEPPLSVDHQSVLNFGSKVEMLENLTRLITSDRVLILGGNDNGGDPDIPEGARPIEALRELRYSSSDVRVRTDGRFCVMFEKDSGRKMRFSFEAPENDNIAAVYTKAPVPELVDLKITNYCDAGRRDLPCAAFCYQGSSEKGKHAPFEKIEAAVNLLADSGVFEIAIGGGEPTSHPRFTDILGLIASRNMTPNFTTGSKEWLSNPDILNAVQEHVGGIGVSVHDMDDLAMAREIRATVKKRNWGSMRVMAQHVVGAVPLSETAELIRVCASRDSRFPLLLLGYKETGFGKKHGRFDGENIDIFLRLGLSEVDLRYMDLSVDTALVQQYPNLMKALRVPDALICPREGAFSCYVDAVAGKMGASSYVATRQMTRLPVTKDEFVAQFVSY